MLILTTGNIEVISRLDDSLNFDSDIYDKYLEDLDESTLEFAEDKVPTRFVLKRILDYKTGVAIKNEQVKVRGKGEMDIRIGSTMTETVRAALVDIKHPDGADPGLLVYKKDSDNGASKMLIALLESHGIVNDLYTAHQNSTGRRTDDKKK